MQARNLLKAGYSVSVWNRSPEKCKELEQEGASIASSSADCVAASDVTIAMLSDPPAALAVAKDAVKGLCSGMQPPAQVLPSDPINCHVACSASQIMHHTSDSHAASVRLAGHDCLDAMQTLGC